MVLHQHAIDHHRQGRGTNEPTFVIKSWTTENDVVHVPLTRRFDGVGQRWELSVNRTGHSVGVRLVLEGVQNLNFVAVQEEHATVPTHLAVHASAFRKFPFEVELAVSIRVTGVNVTCAGVDRQDATIKRPPARLVSGAKGFRSRTCPHQHDRIGRDSVFNRNHRWFGTIFIVHLPPEAIVFRRESTDPTRGQRR